MAALGQVRKGTDALLGLRLSLESPRSWGWGPTSSGLGEPVLESRAGRGGGGCWQEGRQPRGRGAGSRGLNGPQQWEAGGGEIQAVGCRGREGEVAHDPGGSALGVHR